MTPVVIVGLMGAGKSSVGALVATATGRPFVDVDLAIEAGTGKTVRELWEEGGERCVPASRVAGGAEDAGGRSRVAARRHVLDPAVRPPSAPRSSCGCGPIRPRSRPASSTTTTGPLLGDRPFEVLTSMAAERDSLYGSVADLVVDTDGRDADTVAAAVLDELDRRRLNT